METDVETIDRHVLVALLRKRIRLAQELRPFGDRHELDTVDVPRDRHVTVEHANLLDVAALLLEPEFPGEGDRPLVRSIDVRAGAPVALRDGVLGEAVEERCTHAAATALRKHARRQVRAAADV